MAEASVATLPDRVEICYDGRYALARIVKWTKEGNAVLRWTTPDGTPDSWVTGGDDVLRAVARKEAVQI